MEKINYAPINDFEKNLLQLFGEKEFRSEKEMQILREIQKNSKAMQWFMLDKHTNGIVKKQYCYYLFRFTLIEMYENFFKAGIKYNEKEYIESIKNGKEPERVIAELVKNKII